MTSDIDTKPARLIRISEVCRRVGFSRAGIYKLISEGKFPEQINIGPRAVTWIEGEIDDWIRARIAASRGGNGEAKQ